MSNTRCKSGKLPPRSVSEVTSVLSPASFAPFLTSVVSLDYRLEIPTESDPLGYGDDSWGVTAVQEDGIPDTVKYTMMEACLRVPKLQQLATDLRDERFFQGIFINRMCVEDAAQQQRQSATAQHRWHTDTAFKASFMTVVYTIYNGICDSHALTAHEVGGAVGMSHQDDGRFRRASKSQPQTPQSWSTTAYYPKTNSFYIFPGYFVSHAVYKVHPGTVRYSVIMFIRVCRKILGENVDYHLRRTCE